MIIKHKTHLEIKTGERLYQLQCDPDAPLGEVYDALFKMMNYIMQRIDQQNQQQFEIRPQGMKKQDGTTPPNTEPPQST